MADCCLCDRPMSDTAYACHRCATDRGQAIRDAAALLEDLDDAIARRVRMSDPAPRGRLAPAAPIRPDSGIMRHYADQEPGYPSGLPVDLHASAVADTVRNTVTTWARVIVDATGADPPTDLDDLMRWVAGRVDWVRYEPWAAEALDELGYAAGLVGRAVFGPAPRVYLGPCDCGADLYARRGAEYVTCPGCGDQWDVSVREQWLNDQVRDRCFTAKEIAEAYGIRADRIRQWASRGRIVARGSHHGRPLYALPEVLALARTVRVA